MKIFKYYTLTLIVSIFFGLVSCNDTYEFHEEYIKNGEVIYTNKVDSLTTLSGNNRIKINGYISNAFNVNEIIVYWNKGENNQIFTYSKSSNDTDKIELIVENLEEKSYEFKIFSKDIDGNYSVKETTFGTVYGEIYRSNLEARAINSFTFGGDGNAIINLKPSSKLTRGTEIKFTNLTSEVIVINAAKDDTDVVLEALDITKEIMYRTYFVPTAAKEDGSETSIDEFPSDWVVFELPQISLILESIVVTPTLGGVKLNWENPSNQNIKFDFEFMVSGISNTHTVESNETSGFTTIAGMEDVEQTLKITIADLYGNSFGPSEITVQPITVVSLDKSSWTIVDFSSEEPTEANWGPPIQGSAIAAIDGDFSTFWHTAWANSSPDFPHHFTIDLGAEKTIASFEIFRRSGNSGGATKHEFWVSNDNVTFTKVASLNVVLSTNNGYTAAAAENTTGRYVKYLVTDGPKNFTFLGEINIYGVE